MNMNPMALMKLMKAKNEFTANHPKVVSFIQNVIFGGSGIPEGTVLEITITKPGAEPVSTNMKVLASDLALVEELKNLAQ